MSKNIEIPESAKEESILPDMIETLRPSCFKGLEVDKLEIPKGVKQIPINCFKNAKIKALILPDTIETLGSYCFEGLEADKLEIPKGVKVVIESCCFKNAKIKELILPDTIEKVHLRAFLNTNIEVLFITKNKSKFIEAGIKINQIVDLTKHKESFSALRNYTMEEIHQLESVFGCRILPENFYNFENKMSFKSSYFNENLRYKELFAHWKLKDVTRLKVSMIDTVKKEDIEEIENDIESIHINNGFNCSLC